VSDERVVAGKYRLLHPIGSGGMGHVYEAVHTWTRRHVALKLMRPELVGDEHYTKLFRREARTAARIAHPNIAGILDLGEDDDGTLYMAQELVKGESLEKMLARRHRLPVEETVAIFTGILEGLSEAHDAGIIHRDLKPGNVVLTWDRSGALIPKLVDFGVAKGDSSSLTPTGFIVGSAFYLAPEQITEGKAQPKSDLWAVGVCLYECLTGKRPFDGETLPLVASLITSTDPEPPRVYRPDLPERLERVVLRALKREPIQRYEDAEAFRKALALSVGWGVVEVDPYTQTEEVALESVDGLDLEQPTQPAAMAFDPLVIPTTNAQVDNRVTRIDKRQELRFGFVAAAELTSALRRVLSDTFDRRCALRRYLAYGDLTHALIEGEVHVALVPPVGFVRARRLGDVPMLAMVQRRENVKDVSVLLGRDGVSLVELEGTRAAWVDPWSAAGYRVPRLLLAKKGIDPRRVFSSQAFLGHYEGVLSALVHGAADVGASFAQVGTDSLATLVGPFQEYPELNVLALSDPIPPSCLCASPRLDADDAMGVQEILLDPRRVRPLADQLGFHALLAPDEDLYKDLGKRLRGSWTERD